MRTHLRTVVVLFSLIYSVVATTTGLQANDTVDGSTDESSFSDAERWSLQRQVMSMPGVMLDMSNLTDNGYVWKNDVLWEGESLPDNEDWYTAGFYFKRNGYKGVWLQYTFQRDESTGALRGFKRYYGTRTFR